MLFNQLKSGFWGIWGVEQYKYSPRLKTGKHQREAKFLHKILASDLPFRIKLGLNYTYGICNLQGFSKPISSHELKQLDLFYHEAVEFSEEYPEMRVLLQELFLIKKIADCIPGFTGGNIVNESNDGNIHRKYIWLDFFKFSLINYLMRLQYNDITEMSPENFTGYLVLAFFVGSGGFIKEAAVFFDDNDFKTIQDLCIQLVEKIEIYPEYPSLDIDDYRELYRLIVNQIREKKLALTAAEASLKKTEIWFDLFRVANDWYRNYLNTKPALYAQKNPLRDLEKIWQIVNRSETNNFGDLMKVLRGIRIAYDQKYRSPKVSLPININDFVLFTNSPHFLCRQLEMKILGGIFRSQTDNRFMGRAINAIFQEIAAFYSYGDKRVLFEKPEAFQNNLPLLVLAHHIHNPDCEKLFNMMVINRHVYWPVDGRRLLISSSSSNPQKVKQERRNCIELGFTYYRIHARQHLKAGNQNRAFFNAIDFAGDEYYLTLDDDYFVFPEASLAGHYEIRQKNLEYFQFPLTFKGIYKTEVTNGEKADAEAMHYFETTFGANNPPTMVFPRGTGTIFNFKDGVSILSYTGGFFIGSVAEDFGQGLLGLFAKTKENFSPGEIGTDIWCIGEGVEISGKLPQIFRWSRGMIEILNQIFYPNLYKSIFAGNIKSNLRKGQIFRFFLFTSCFITLPFTLLITYLLPFLSYAFEIKINFYHLNQLVIPSLFILSMIVSQIFLKQNRISLAPFRIIALHYTNLFACVSGYMAGLFSRKRKWNANKTRKINWAYCAGPLLLILVNLFPFLWLLIKSQLINWWMLWNFSFIMAGFWYLFMPFRLSGVSSGCAYKTKFLSVMTKALISISILFMFLYYFYIFIAWIQSGLTLFTIFMFFTFIQSAVLAYFIILYTQKNNSVKTSAVQLKPTS